MASVCLPYVRLFGPKQKDVPSLFTFNSAAVYGIGEAPAKQEGLKFYAKEDVEVLALIYSQHRIVLEARTV